MSEKSAKPLGRKSYGSIGHLPDSRMGPSDHHVHEGQARICTEKVRDKRDRVYVTEKVDGSCCAVAKVDGHVVALGRAGYLAQTSKFEQHQLFSDWVNAGRARFDVLLEEGERVVGEWLAQAHGTRYKLTHEPFVPFDIMREARRAPFNEVVERVCELGLRVPMILRIGPAASVEDAVAIIGEHGFHGAQEQVEGAVWRVERDGVFDFMAKWVRPDKVDGCYLPEMSGAEPVWNWRP